MANNATKVNILNIEKSQQKKLKTQVLSLDRRRNGEEWSIIFLIRISIDKWFAPLFSDHLTTCAINNHTIQWKLIWSASLDRDSCNVTNCLTYNMLKNHQCRVYRKYHLLLFMSSPVSTRKFIRINKQCTLYFGVNLHIKCISWMTPQWYIKYVKYLLTVI